MNILIDTSVWISHFRKSNQALVHLLEFDLVLTHPMVVVELACGHYHERRAHILNSVGLLQPCKPATLDEVRELIEREKLYGRGCGLVDMVLLASTLLTSAAKLWTFDKHLAALAQQFNVNYQPSRS
jgi:predicted nucleic acid-binding protein